MEPRCEGLDILQSTTFGKEIDLLGFVGQSEKELESEPDGELDPAGSDAASEIVVLANDISHQVVQEEQPKKSRKKQSLIDKAFKLQQKQQVQEAHEEAERQLEPAYIWFADLAADWSCYIAKPVTMSSPNPVPVSMFMQEADDQSAICQPQVPDAIEGQTGNGLASSKPKRKGKKSLIDKAASRQRKELSAQIQTFEPTEISTTKPQCQIYCTLCEGRTNRKSCGLCGVRS
jgi:hypothetical protein